MEYNDKYRLDKFLESLSEERLDEVSNYLLKGELPKPLVETLLDYRDSLTRVLSRFDDEEIQEAKKIHDMNFGFVLSSVMKYFKPVGEEWYVLHPIKTERMDDMTKEDRETWSKRNTKVHLEVMDWILSYKNFLKLALKKLKQVSSAPGRIKILIDKDKQEVHRADNSKTHPFRKAGGKNKRFDMVMAIAQHPKIGAAKLSDNARNASKEVGNINRLIKKGLRLTKPLIINRKNSGYQVDSDTYDISII